MPRHENNKSGIKRKCREYSTPVFGHVDGWRLMNICLAEFLGTGLLVCLGCMSTVHPGGESPSMLHIGFAFGVIIAGIIQIVGHISAAHLNPAVTVCSVILGKINLPLAGLYFLSELSGGIVGYAVLESVLPYNVRVRENGESCGVCVTVPSDKITLLQALLIEIIITSVLILLVCSVWDRRHAHTQDSASLKFGFVIAAIACIAGPYTGASMNPARSLGPALWTGVWTHHWIYWVGPLLSSVLSSTMYRYIFGVEDEELPGEQGVPLTAIRSSKGDEAGRDAE